MKRPSTWAARLSWLAPSIGLAIVGVLDGVALPSRPLLVLVGAGVVIGLLAALVARSRAGLAVNAVVVVAAGVAYAFGNVDRVRHRDEMEKLQKSANVAAGEYPGWYGATAGGGVRVYAVELAPGSPLAKTIMESFARPFAPLVVGVDNRAGDHDLELDLAALELELVDGRSRPALPRGEVLSSARSHQEALAAAHGHAYRIRRGEQLKNALAFLSPDSTMKRVVGVTVKVDGRPLTIAGRYYTAEEKLARRGSR